MFVEFDKGSSLVLVNGYKHLKLGLERPYLGGGAEAAVVGGLLRTQEVP